GGHGEERFLDQPELYKIHGGSKAAMKKQSRATPRQAMDCDTDSLGCLRLRVRFPGHRLRARWQCPVPPPDRSDPLRCLVSRQWANGTRRGTNPRAGKVSRSVAVLCPPVGTRRREDRGRWPGGEWPGRLVLPNRQR